MPTTFSENNRLPKKLKTSDENFIAYHSTDISESNNLPGIIFMTGYMSNMDGSKALAIEEFAQERGQSFVRCGYWCVRAASKIATTLEYARAVLASLGATNKDYVSLALMPKSG